MKRSARQMPQPIREISLPASIVRLNESFGTDTRAYSMGEISILAGREPHGFSTTTIKIPVSMDPASFRWHMSVSHPARYPTWDEMSEAREKLLPMGLVFALIFPASWDEYVNLHPNCFHLWEVHDRDG